MNFIKKHKIILVLLILSIGWFCVYTAFNVMQMNTNVVKLASPDETANYFFTKQFAETGNLYYFEELSGVGSNLVHPRSVNVVDGKNAPGSFIGLPVIYGSLVKLGGIGLLPYLTPLFSVLGIISFFFLLKYIFKREDLALVSVILLMFFPGWWYYSARGLYHNVLFIALLLIGIYLLFISLNKKNSKIQNTKYQISKFLLYFVSGGLIGLALITRTAEIAWVGITVLLIFIFNFRKIYWPGLILFIAGVWLPILWLFYYNMILYNSVLSLGYSAIIPGDGIGQAVSSGIIFKILISPFGFHPRVALLNAFTYLYALLPIWSWPALLGAILFVLSPKNVFQILNKERYLYFLYFLFVTGYLIIFYGSWQFSDRIDGSTVSLGTSYLRYWLPVYVLAMPFIASLMLFIAKPFSWLSKKRGQLYMTAVILLLIMVIFIPTINLVIQETDESLVTLRNLPEARVKSNIVINKLEPDAVFVVYKQADKILFPENNNIITELVNVADYKAVVRLAKIRPVYYYTFAPDEVIQKLIVEKFQEYGLEFGPRERIFGQDAVYRMQIKNDKK